MPKASSGNSIFTLEQMQDANKALKQLADAKELCDRAGKCGLPVDEMIQEIDFMIDTLNKIKQHFMTGQKPVPAKG